jgi:hypothetical protein
MIWINSVYELKLQRTVQKSEREMDFLNFAWAHEHSGRVHHYDPRVEYVVPWSGFQLAWFEETTG